VHAQVTIQGNGKQRFVVPVSVTVEMEGTPVARRPGPAAEDAPRGLPEMVRQGIHAVWRGFLGEE
jgi:hypothetical protein